MGKTVVCPGSFDPLTLGHLDIISRSAKLFDKVIVVVMRNMYKDAGSFTIEERMDFIRRCTKDMPNVEVDTYTGKRNKIVKNLRQRAQYELITKDDVFYEANAAGLGDLTYQEVEEILKEVRNG